MKIVKTEITVDKEELQNILQFSKFELDEILSSYENSVVLEWGKQNLKKHVRTSELPKEVVLSIEGVFIEKDQFEDFKLSLKEQILIDLKKEKRKNHEDRN